MKFADFGQTIALIRKELHLSQKEVSEKFEQLDFATNGSCISKWEQNKNMPNVLQFFHLCEIYGITDINHTFHVADDQNYFARLNDTGKEKAIDYMRFLLTREENREKQPAKIYQMPPQQVNLRTLPVYDDPVSAGSGQFLDSDHYTEMEVGDDVSLKADFGVRVAGDSMEPRFLNGQIIWIHQQDELADNEIGIFCLNNESYVKKIHISDYGIELISLNQNYAPIIVTEESTFKIFGKVVG